MLHLAIGASLPHLVNEIGVYDNLSTVLCTLCDHFEVHRLALPVTLTLGRFLLLHYFDSNLVALSTLNTTSALPVTLLIGNSERFCIAETNGIDSL